MRELCSPWRSAMHESRTRSATKRRKHNTSQRGHSMKTIQRYALSSISAAMLLGLGGCSGMSTQDKNTAIGAGVGAVGGAVLTGGSTAGTVGGAAVGGIIGHEVDDDK